MAASLFRKSDFRFFSLSWLDPGWLFLIAGAAMLGATALVPALADLRDAEVKRGRAEALAAHELRRLEAYAAHIDAIDSRNALMVASLVASQLNELPAESLLLPGDPAAGLPTHLLADASLIRWAEPSLAPVAERPTPDSALRGLTTNPGRRLWVMAASALLVLIGLLPPTKKRAQAAQATSGEPDEAFVIRRPERARGWAA